MHSARSLPSKPPSHITLCTEMVKNAPVPSPQEFLSPSFHRVQPGGPCSLAQSLQREGSSPSWGQVRLYGYPLSLHTEG